MDWSFLCGARIRSGSAELHLCARALRYLHVRSSLLSWYGETPPMKKKTKKMTPARAAHVKRSEMIEALHLIRGHAQAMVGKVAHINDKTGPILYTCESMLTRLGVSIENAAARDVNPLDIGQGEGCEGSKCAVPSARA